MSANNASSAPRLALSVPLSSLFDPDDDRSDVARKELDADEYKYDEEADAAEELIDGDRAGSSSPADLADSRWEPLRFPEQANVFQQVSPSATNETSLGRPRFSKFRRKIPASGSSYRRQFVSELYPRR